MHAGRKINGIVYRQNNIGQTSCEVMDIMYHSNHATDIRVSIYHIKFQILK